MFELIISGAEFLSINIQVLRLDALWIMVAVVAIGLLGGLFAVISAKSKPATVLATSYFFSLVVILSYGAVSLDYAIMHNMITII